MRMLLIAQVACLLLAGCVSREDLLRGQNHTRVSLEETNTDRIGKVAEEVFKRHGFTPAPATNPQELVLTKSGTPLLKFLKGGQAIVWLVMEPRASGWDVYCVPEPDGLYTGGSATRFDGLLGELQAELKKPAAR